MKPRKEDPVELTVEKMAFGGEGVARLDGLVVFVRGGLPGDRVRAGILKKKKGYAEARVLEILSPSPDRILPPCPYFPHCGGCKWQHALYARQLEYKRDHVVDAMTRIGALPGTPVRETLPSDRIFAYRNKMEFSFSTRRWLLPGEFEAGEDGDGLALGLHVPGTFNKVIEIDGCLLQSEEGNRILQEVKNFARESGLSAYGLKTHEGFWRFLTLRHSHRRDEWMVNVITAEENRPVMESLSKRLTARFDRIRTIVHSISARKAAIAIGERETTIHGDGNIEDGIGPFVFRISADSFFQTNSLTAETLYGKVLEYAELTGSERVLDLYSGTGTIPIFLSGQTSGEIIGMEISAVAVQDAQMNCRANRIPNCRFIVGDIKDTLPALHSKPDVVVIDPPRAGMHKDALSRVLELGAERVVYVSCNPPTLARDLSVLAQGYEIMEVQPVDMFPHTYHIEAVAKLARRKGERR
jgi:23S rRNA (uracil1939-C5)-methyltransferase